VVARFAPDVKPGDPLLVGEIERLLAAPREQTGAPAAPGGS
jgi:hypothetical protein